MLRKIVSALGLTMLLIGMLSLAFIVKPVKASGTVYIRADGSIDPPTANITTANNVTYTLTDNISSNAYGIVVERDNVVVDGGGYILQGTGTGTGMHLNGRSNVTIKNMHIKAFQKGIYLYLSSNNSISGNNITNNSYGVVLSSSSNNVFRGNRISDNNYNFGLVGGVGFSDFVNDVDASNTVDGKPIYYWINKQDMAVPFDAGYVALVNCTEITVQNLSLTSNEEGVLLAYTTNSTIGKNTITNNSEGIVFGYASNCNIVSGNNITNNGCGIWLRSSSNNLLSGNNITNNGVSIELSSSSNNNTIYGNNIRNHGDGMAIHDSSNNSISGNNITENYEESIELSSSSNNTISGNNITNNQYAVYLTHANYNIISGNIIKNNELGILLSNSGNNTLYHNNFLDNTQQVHIETSDYANSWDDDYPSGGNRWSDYAGVDLYSGPNQEVPGSDGIGDTPYIIDATNQDNYPFMESQLELTVTSLPITGITFTIDETPQITPYADILPEGSYTLVMPETHDGYVWSHWLEDGDIDRVKTIILEADPTWTGVYVLATLPVGGVWVPVNNYELLAPWIGLASLMIVSAASTAYVKHRKKQQD